jgi:hypothetical protein
MFKLTLIACKNEVVMLSIKETSEHRENRNVTISQQSDDVGRSDVASTVAPG